MTYRPQIYIIYYNILLHTIWCICLRLTTFCVQHCKDAIVCYLKLIAVTSFTFQYFDRPHEEASWILNSCCYGNEVLCKPLINYAHFALLESAKRPISLWGNVLAQKLKYVNVSIRYFCFSIEEIAVLMLLPAKRWISIFQNAHFINFSWTYYWKCA